MKYVVGTILVLLCFPFGQLVHKFLVGPHYKEKFAQQQKQRERQNLVMVEVPTPGGKSVIKIDLRYLSEDEIPEKVKLAKRVEVSSEDGTTIALEAGSAVRVVGR